VQQIWRKQNSPQAVAIATNQNSGLDKVTIGINWVAQSKQGRLYQAIATAIFKNYGTLNRERLTGKNGDGLSLIHRGWCAKSLSNIPNV
jgi:spermidine/putrescine-binding protein